jgi:hypothetical protein
LTFLRSNPSWGGLGPNEDHIIRLHRQCVSQPYGGGVVSAGSERA